MVIYLIVEVLILFLVFLFRGKQKKVYYELLILLLCLMGLFRGQTVGTDVIGYSNNIRHTTFDSQTWNYEIDFESGYNVLIACYNVIGDSPLFFIGLCNVFFILCWSHYNKVKCIKYDIGLMSLYMLGYYMQSYNIIRQYFALSMMLLVLSYYNVEKSKLRDDFLLLGAILAIGLLFHNSSLAFICIPIYKLIKNTFINTKWFYIGGVIASALLFYSKIIKDLLGTYAAGLFLLNEKSNTYFQHSLEGIVEEGEYSLFRMLFDTMFLLFLIFRTYMFFCAQLFMNLFAPLNTLFARIPVVLVVASIPLIVNIWSCKGRIDKTVIILYFTIIFANVLIKNYGDFQPYVLNF